MRVIAGSARGVGLRAPSGSDTRPTSDKIRGVIFNVLAGVVNGSRVLDLYAGSGALGVEALSRGAEGCLFVEHGVQAARAVEDNLRVARVAARGTVWRLDVSKALDRLEALAAASSAPDIAAPGETDRLSRDDEEGERTAAEEAGVSAPARPSRGTRGAAGVGERGGRSISLPEGCAPPYTIVVLDPPYADASIIAVVERIGAARLLEPGALVVLEHSKRLSPPEEVGMLHLWRARRYGDTVVTIWEYPREG